MLGGREKVECRQRGHCHHHDDELDDKTFWAPRFLHMATCAEAIRNVKSREKKLASIRLLFNIAAQLRFAARMKAKIIITPKKAVLDPQGKTVQNALDHMGYKGVGAVHVGKYMEIELPDGDKETWRKQIDDACHKILSNPVIEDYKIEITD